VHLAGLYLFARAASFGVGRDWIYLELKAGFSGSTVIVSTPICKPRIKAAFAAIRPFSPARINSGTTTLLRVTKTNRAGNKNDITERDKIDTNGRWNKGGRFFDIQVTNKSGVLSYLKVSVPSWSVFSELSPTWLVKCELAAQARLADVSEFV
jgi:hypothetical protein